MKYRYSILTVCGIVTAALLCWLLSMHGKQELADISALADENIHIMSLPDSTSHDDYADLEFLTKELSGKNIVVLGEALHYDGSTFLIKTRMVKFLHERLGFNTLLFEGGIYDLHLLQQKLESNPDNAEPESSLWAFWTESDQVRTLWEYIRSGWQNDNLSKTALHIGGIDCQHSGNLSDSLRFAMLDEVCKGSGIDLEKEFPAFSSFMPQMTKTMLYRSYFRYKYTPDSLMVLNNELKTLADSLNKHDIFIGKYIDGIRNRMLYSREYEAGDSARTVWRDSLMAENFILHRNLHPDEKIIVWTSNMHASKAGALNYGNPKKPIKNLGSRLHSTYGDSLYVILFHNWSRESNDGHNVSFLKSTSAEYAIHKELYPQSGGRFLYFSQPEEFGEAMFSGIMEGEFVCSPGKMCNALIYEDNVEFVRYKDE